MLTRTAVLGRTTVPGRERSVPQARAFVARVLGPGHRHGYVARLLVSELVSNSVLHSESRRPGGMVTVTVIHLADGIRIEVTDEGSARSVPTVKDDMLATSGRGLYLVESLAADWGYQQDDARTTVWFALRE